MSSRPAAGAVAMLTRPLPSRPYVTTSPVTSVSRVGATASGTLAGACAGVPVGLSAWAGAARTAANSTGAAAAAPRVPIRRHRDPRTVHSSARQGCGDLTWQQTIGARTPSDEYMPRGMIPPQGGPVLEAIGLSAEESRLYTTLIDHPHS